MIFSKELKSKFLPELSKKKLQKSKIQMNTNYLEVLIQLQIKIEELLQFYNLQEFHVPENVYVYIVFHQNHGHGHVVNFLF